MAVVYTGGTFDLMHAGHVDLLRVCRRVAGPSGKVVVSLIRDEFVARFKPRPPVCSYAERRAVLLVCSYVDSVVENSGDEDSTKAIDAVKPDFILIGDDWAQRDYCKQMGFTPDWLDVHGITLLYVPRLRNISSTAIKDRVHGQLARESVSDRPLE